MSIAARGVPITLTYSYDSLDAVARRTSVTAGGSNSATRTCARVCRTSASPRRGCTRRSSTAPRSISRCPAASAKASTFTPDQHGILSLTYFTPRFTSDNGVTDQISVPNVYLIQGADGNFYTLNGQLPYNPASPDFGGGYQVVTKDGLILQ